jgi:hypothetical protein
MAEGIDIKAFAKRQRTLSEPHRSQEAIEFGAWNRKAIRQGRDPITIAIVIWGAALLVGILTLGDDAPLSPIWLFAAVAGVIAGLPLFALGARREKRWRRANPFKAH